MRPRLGSRGELDCPEATSSVSVLQCGHGSVAVENATGAPAIPVGTTITSMRPRLGSRGEPKLEQLTGTTAFRLQCGHGSVAVENSL